jgi:aspartate aminotransferase
MTIANKIGESLKQSSLIRKMFEEGAQMKAKYGAENVFDFSLGNPNVAPPDEFYSVLRKTAIESNPADHAYMPQAGNPETREAIAKFISGQQGVSLSANEIFMTAGAAAALNIVFKTILDPEDEVIVPSPYFVEYGFYVNNYNGLLKDVSTKEDFSLDIDAVEAEISEKTKAVIINSPNNPTGQVYSRKNLQELSTLLKDKSREMNRTIYLISDEPYRAIIYGDVTVPSILDIYPESMVVTSYAKDLSLPGERLGYAAICPEMTHKDDVINGMNFAGRISGYVNAPAFMQRVVGPIQGLTVDVSEYQRKLDLIAGGLSDCGYDFVIPKGAFYLFPKSPIPDDFEFTAILKEERILVTPGSGFKGPGHFRIAYCVDDSTIVNSLPGFKRAMEKIK